MSLQHPGRHVGLSDHDGDSPDRVRLLPVRVDGLPVCVAPSPGLGGVQIRSVLCQRPDLSTKDPV